MAKWSKRRRETFLKKAAQPFEIEAEVLKNSQFEFSAARGSKLKQNLAELPHLEIFNVYHFLSTSLKEDIN